MLRQITRSVMTCYSCTSSQHSLNIRSMITQYGEKERTRSIQTEKKSFDAVYWRCSSNMLIKYWNAKSIFVSICWTIIWDRGISVRNVMLLTCAAFRFRLWRQQRIDIVPRQNHFMIVLPTSRKVACASPPPPTYIVCRATSETKTTNGDRLVGLL